MKTIYVYLRYYRFEFVKNKGIKSRQFSGKVKWGCSPHSSSWRRLFPGIVKFISIDIFWKSGLSLFVSQSSCPQLSLSFKKFVWTIWLVIIVWTVLSVQKCHFRLTNCHYCCQFCRFVDVFIVWKIVIILWEIVDWKIVIIIDCSFGW